MSKCPQTTKIGASSAKRMLSIDFLRGIALVVVLIDHIDWVALDFGFIVDWSLAGFGFSDFAEVFVYLSGFTFGWVYSDYLERVGLGNVALKISWRWLQLVFGYFLTSALVCGISTFSDQPFVHRSGSITESLTAILWLGYQPFTLMIICLYISLLPILTIALVTYRQFPKFTIATSAGLYSVVQFNPQLNLCSSNSSWIFNPFAWQFLMILAMTVGYCYRRKFVTHSAEANLMVSAACFALKVASPEDASRKQSILIASRLLLGGAIAVLAFGLFVEKGKLILGDENYAAALSAIHFSQNATLLIDKSRIAPLRIVYFFSLAYVVYVSLPKNDSFWSKRIFGPIRACGRNSLTVYCVGVVLTHLASVIFDWVGASPGVIVLTAFNACLIQFLVAICVDGFRRKRRRFAPDSCSTANTFPL